MTSTFPARRLRVFPALSALLLALTATGWHSTSLAQASIGTPHANQHSHQSPHPSLQLEASASRQVPEDTAWVVLVVERESPAQAQAQQQAQSALAELISQAKQAGSELEVNTESMFTSPIHAPKTNQITGWRAHLALRIQSTQAGLVAQTAAALLPKARLQGAGFFLSPARRQAVEQTLIGEAVQEFERKAQTTAKAMGFARTAYRQVALQQGSGTVSLYGKASMVAASMQAEGDARPSLAMEPGKTEVAVSVSGTVDLLR